MNLAHLLIALIHQQTHKTHSFDRPDNRLTPGDALPIADCGFRISDCRKGLWPTLDRKVPVGVKPRVFGAHGVLWAERWRYDLDHLAPLCLGGTNAAENLWPHAWDSEHPPRLKMRLERRLMRHVRRGMLAMKEALRFKLVGERLLPEKFP